MTLDTLLCAIAIGLCGLLVISGILVVAFGDDYEWPKCLLVILFILLIAVGFTGIICKYIGVLDAPIF